MGFPSSSSRGLKIAVVACRRDEDVKVLLTTFRCRNERWLSALLRHRAGDATLGRRKSRTGELVWRYCSGASWRKARAAEEGVDVANCEQLLAIHRDAMVIE